MVQIRGMNGAKCVPEMQGCVLEIREINGAKCATLSLSKCVPE